MKDVRIFIASSKELVAERNQFAFLVLSMEGEFGALPLGSDGFGEQVESAMA